MPIVIDVEKARLIKADRLRAQRKPLLEKLDVDYIRATEAGNTELIAEIVAKKQALRDLTTSEELLSANTVEQLKQISIPEELK
jgi:hypothetical protein